MSRSFDSNKSEKNRVTDHSQGDYSEKDFLLRAEQIKKKQVYRKRPKQARDLINVLLARKGYSQVETNNQLQTKWESILDFKWKNRTLATSIRAGRLDVLVESAVVNQELTFIKTKLLAKLKETSIGKGIRDIRFRIGSL